jgi:hypothetical protein
MRIKRIVVSVAEIIIIGLCWGESSAILALILIDTTATTTAKITIGNCAQDAWSTATTNMINRA